MVHLLIIMFPSSSRVKLNRVAIKDVGPKVAPRRRRPPKCETLTADSTEKHGHNCVWEVVSEEEAALASCNSNEPFKTLLTCEKRTENGTETHNSEPGGGPEESCVVTKKAKKNYPHACTREDMECKQSGQNTRGKYKQSKPNTRRTLRLNHQRSVSLGFSFTCCSDSGCLKSTKGRSEVKTIKMPCPMKLPREAHLVAQAADRRFRAGKAGFRAAGGFGHRSQGSACDAPRSTAGTSSLPRPASSINRNNPSEPDGSPGYLRRSVAAPQCVLCGKCKCLSPQQKNFVQQSSKSSSLGSELATTEVKRDNRVAETPEKSAAWNNKYPKVTLCDVAKISDTCSHNCGYILSDVLKTKVVHCFKQHLNAGFWIRPTCSGHKQKSEERILVLNNQRHPSVSVEKSTCLPQIPTEHLEKEMDSQTTQSPAPHFHNGCTEENAAAASPFLTDKQTEEGECSTSLQVEEDSGQGSILMGAETHKDKRIKLVDGVGCSRSCSSDLKENCIIKNLGDKRGEATEVNGTPISSDVSSESDETDTNHPETFTCQRVKAYKGKIINSCARTCMSWPFSKGSAGSADPSVTGSQIQTNSSTKQSKNTHPDTAMQKQNCSSESNATRCTNVPSHWNRTNMEMKVCFMQSEGSPSSLQSDAVLFPSFFSSLQERDPGDRAPSSPFPVNGPETDSSISTPSSTALCPSDWEIATSLAPLSGPSMQGTSSSLSGTSHSLPSPSQLSEEVKDTKLHVERKFLFCGDIKLAAPSFSSSVPSNNSYHLIRSPSLPHHGKHKNDTFLTDRSPPKLESIDAGPFKDDSSLFSFANKMDSSEFRLPPLLSPVTSPQVCWWNKSLLCQSSDGSENEEEKVNKDADKIKTSPEYHMAHINGSEDNSEDSFECNAEETEGCTGVEHQSHDNEDECDQTEEKRLDDSDSEDEFKQGSRSSEQVPLDCGDLAEARFSPSSDEDDHTAFSQEEEQLSDTEGSSTLELAGRESHEPKAEAAGDHQPAILDEFTAYEQDILLVDVMQDDSELFRNLPKQSLLKLGPARKANVPQRMPTAVVTGSSRIDGASSEVEQKLTAVIKNFVSGVPDLTEESDSRPWRPRCSTTPTKIQNSCPATYKQTRHVGHFDANNNHVNDGLERGHSIHNTPPLLSVGNGPWIKNTANMMNLSPQNSNPYCRQYFSEATIRGFKMSPFQHLPVEGDEKLCVETVARFTKNPVCLQKAGAVFTGYYQNNPPGKYFSMPVFLSLLWALLKASKVSDVFSVLAVSLAHNIVPGHEFLLGLFTFVRANGLMGFIPKLMQLTLKMTSAGLELNLDCLDCVKNTPMFQQMLHPNSSVALSGNHKLFTSTLTPEYLNLAHAVVEVELCIKQEDWKQMGEVFKTICQYHQHPNQVERISGRIAIALLCESKNRASLPFADFAETVCQSEDENSPIKNFVGRIGVSLMLRYHKTQQWFKGRKVVEVMSTFKVNYTTLKGLFGNEDRASRCCLVTVATELLLLSGCVEGALKTLQENDWFLSSCLWPCEPADLESRTCVLIRLAEKTSHRDTLEVLCNLPGIKDPNNFSRYSPLFNSHLQACVKKQMLLVASDTVDFMLCKNLPVDHSVLQTLVHKLGKQNLWLRARGVFKRSVSSGNYSEVSAPPGLMTLAIPCQLMEVELALIFEMFITVNGSAILLLPETTTSSLSITLKRTESCESEYISAGNRILCAARIPQPKLIVHYTAVNSSQEQVFRLDVSSASRWFCHNRTWASEMWAH